jgi:stress-induced morphogen
MPISLRLPEAVEQQIAGYCARQGRSKSAVIAQSIQEFLAKNAEPTSLEIYDEAMRNSSNAGEAMLASPHGGMGRVSTHKSEFAAAVQAKHLARSKRATKALEASRKEPTKGSKAV